MLEIAFWSATACALYAQAGYPLLLAVAAAVRPGAALRPRAWQPKVTVVVVAHNEEARIARKLDNLLELDHPRDLLEILVASDGSTDGTCRVVAGYEARGVRLVERPGPRGKADALNAVVPGVGGEVVLLSDARQDLDRDALRRLLQVLSDPAVGAVSGELVLTGPGSLSGEGIGRYWQLEKLLRRLESRFDSTVGATGAIYALRRELYRPIPPETVLDDVLIPLEIAAQGRRVLFEPGAIARERTGSSASHEYRRKVRTLAGNLQLVALRPWLLDPRRNRLLWQFASHKLSRLMMPWCMLVLLATSVALTWSTTGARRWLYGLALAAQLTLYALAGAGAAAERIGARTRGLSLPWAFTLLNVAAAHALFAFLGGRTRANWKQAA